MDAAGRLSLSIRELSERYHFRCRHIRRDVWRKSKSEVRAIWAFRIDSELRLLFEWSLLKPSHPVAGLFFMCIGQEEKRTRLLAHRFMRAFVLLRLSVG